jgi:hypothetical protein
LRAGFLTSAAARGASIFKMMDVSRHRSVDTLRGYVRDAELFKDHAGAGLFRPRTHRRAMTAVEAAVVPYKNVAPEGADRSRSRSTAACSAYSRAAICYADANTA